MYYIGIDPSTSSTGYAVVNKKKEIIKVGKIDGLADSPETFARLYKELVQLFEDYPPVMVLCENQYFGGNTDTLIKISRPGGVVLAAVGLFDTMFDFIMPSSWRKEYLGNGSLSKRESYDQIIKTYPELIKAIEPYALLKNGKVSQTRLFTKGNDITDAVGLACACVTLAEEKEDE